MKIRNYPASPENYSRGRRGHPVRRIIIHTMEGGLVGTAHWFADPKASTSAHYGIGRDGTTLRFVEEGDTAWHCGNAPYNRESIGIELEGSCRNAFMTLEMLVSLVELTIDIATRHAIPLTREYLIGHCEVPHPRIPGRLGGASGHTDPGEHMPWDEYLQLVTTRAPPSGAV